MAPRAVPAQLIEGPSRALGTTEDGQLRLVGLSQPAESTGAKDFLSDDLKDTLTDADRVSRVINSYLERTSGLEFLKDINFRLKTFHQDGGETNLGFSYAFSRIVKDYHFGSTSPTTHRGLDLSFNATGNVAFDRSTNPEDFLDTKLDLGFFQSTGGAGELSGTDKQKYSDMVDEIVSKYHAADPKVIRNSPEMKQVDELTRSHLTNQLALDFAGEAALESDQSFSKKQYVYGGRLGLVFKAWNEDSAWTRWNILDFPFATIRALSGTDTKFSPRGTSYPAVLAGAALVDPDAGDPRAKVGDESRFPRVRSEVSFRTPLIDLGQWGPTQRLGLVHVTANHRYYREINASSAVKRANLDDFSYFVATLDSQAGVFVSYSDGRLPFDTKNDQIYDLGFKFHF